MADQRAKSVVNDNMLPIPFLTIHCLICQINLKMFISSKLSEMLGKILQYLQYLDLILHILTTFSINNRYLYIFFMNNAPFQQHLYQINKRDSTYCIYNKPSTSLHYILECPLTTHFYVKQFIHVPKRLVLKTILWVIIRGFTWG